MYEMLQKMKDVSAPVIHIHLARVYIEKLWKNRALELKKVFCVNT